jgi:hypothetical protein
LRGAQAFYHKTLKISFEVAFQELFDLLQQFDVFEEDALQ